LRFEPRPITAGKRIESEDTLLAKFSSSFSPSSLVMPPRLWRKTQRPTLWRQQHGAFGTIRAPVLTEAEPSADVDAYEAANMQVPLRHKRRFEFRERANTALALAALEYAAVPSRIKRLPSAVLRGWMIEGRFFRDYFRKVLTLRANVRNSGTFPKSCP
jgi:hypothetical protein